MRGIYKGGGLQFGEWGGRANEVLKGCGGRDGRL